MVFDLSSVGEPIDARYPSDLAVASIAALQGARPDWVARNASVEVVLVEALALAAADVSNAANAAVAALAELLLGDFYGVARLSGSPAVGQVTVTFDATVTTTVPTGMRFVLADFGVEVASTADVTVTAGTSAALQVVTVESTSLVNGVGAGAAVDVLDVIPNLLGVAVTAAFVGGADPEDDVSYLARARVRLARVTNSLVVPAHFAAWCLEDGRAVNAATIPAWDGVSLASAGTDAGEVTVVTYGRGGNVSEEVRAEMAASMQAITAAGVNVHVNAAAVSTVAVTCTVASMPGYASDEVRAAVEAAITGFLNPQVWVIGADVVRAQLQDRITSIPQVDYVSALSAPAADVTVPADGVAKAGTLTVSVT